ncbi:MAG: hypothetical protein RJA09_429 [Pseudomonadota bacterium]|jgi:DNA-binding MarR family transcriptional regulator
MPSRKPAPAEPTTPAPDHNPLALDNQLCFALYATMLGINKAYRPLLKSLGLTYPQYLVMLVLWEHDGLTVSAIGDRLGLDSATLTPLLKRLETGGRVQRQRSAQDERQVIITLTAAGRALRVQAKPVPTALFGAMGCDLAELRELKQRVNGLRQQLQAHTG